MAVVTAAFFDMLEKEQEIMRILANRPPREIQCGEDFKKHMVIGHTGQPIRCYTCQGTNRSPIPWAEVMQHG